MLVQVYFTVINRPDHRNIYIFPSEALTYLFILTVKRSVETSTDNQLPSLYISPDLKLIVCTEGGCILNRNPFMLNELNNNLQ